MRRAVIGSVLCVALALGVVAVLGWQTRGPLAERLGYERAEIAPEFVSSITPPGDPSVMMLVFPWAEEGYCAGQFTATATEDDSRVVVSQVKSRIARNAICAGLGTSSGRAAVEVSLQAPLGSRTFVRKVDGREIETRRDWHAG